MIDTEQWLIDYLWDGYLPEEDLDQEVMTCLYLGVLLLLFPFDKMCIITFILCISLHEIKNISRYPGSTPLIYFCIIPNRNLSKITCEIHMLPDVHRAPYTVLAEEERIFVDIQKALILGTHLPTLKCRRVPGLMSYKSLRSPTVYCLLFPNHFPPEAEPNQRWLVEISICWVVSGTCISSRFPGKLALSAASQGQD